MYKLKNLNKTMILFSIVILLFVTNFNIIVACNNKTANTTIQQYDMVIIAPKSFTYFLKSLIEHKNKHDISTIIKNTEDIYKIFPGRDKPEQIKYFIKYALETWKIKYVLLIGGKKGQTNDWYIPVRYSHLEDKLDTDEKNWESSFISDLYYADIYKNNGTEFEDWDSNGNNIFAEWKWQTNTSQDILDLEPDVYVGRLACRNIFEVKTVVKKIITYETQTYGQSWFKNVALIGGDTLPGDHFYEGEIETEQTKIIMERLGFNTTKLWTSIDTLNNPGDVIRTIRNGAGFVHMTGHGNPMIWSTHKPKNDEWVNGLLTYQIKKLRNYEKLPIFIISSCHDSQFNVTIFNLLRGILGNKYLLFTGVWVPECLSWHLVRQKNGGAIATIGNTGLGYVLMGKRCIENSDSWMNIHFFEKYSNYTQNDINFTLGKLHWDTIEDYIDTFDVYNNYIDCKTVQQRTLLGDPSLKIGGYN